MISIVVIGKNEASNLATLYESLQKIAVSKEIIYVDSASSDNSVVLSTEYCNAVYELEDSPHLCAAAGRYIGTQKATHNWVLYLDGDMELQDDFITFINNQDFQNYDAKIAGFMGYYDYQYSDGTNDENRLLQPANKIVAHFGGAVMLQKNIVLDAGNWNPSVVANEEIDLYVRIQSLGYKVFGLDNKMVKHLAKKVSNVDTLLHMFWPMDRRFYGFGQVLVSQYKQGTLLKFMLMRPQPFIFLLLLFTSPFFPSSLLLLLLSFVYVTVTKKWHYNLIYLSDIFRASLGVFVYSSFTPMIKSSSLQTTISPVTSSN